MYAPRSWTSDPDRCRDAGLDQDTAFATKPELATRMVARFPDAGHQAAWVAGDEIYGGNLKLRTALEERGTGYVLAVARSHEVTTEAGKFRADILAKKVPKRAWQKLSAGAGAKGHRFYNWAHDAAHRLGWSGWRRRHQARSQASHYRQQATQA